MTDSACMASIETVVSAVNGSQSRYADTLVISDNTASHLVLQIEEMSRLVLDARLSTVGLTSALKNNLSEKIIKSIDCVANSIPRLEGGMLPVRRQSILRACRRHTDENLHSAILSSLLDMDITGKFSSIFLSEIVKEIFGEAPDMHPPYQFSNTEIQLDSLGYDEGIGLRRLDILVLRPKEVLVIENKVWSSESDNQTSDYSEAIKRVYPDRRPYCILLSPFGSDGACRDFKGLSYKQLLFCLARSIKLTPDMVSKIPEFYLNELTDIVFDFYR